MPLVIAVAVLAWFIFGTPTKDVANWFWPGDAAPWETVDAFYYPDPNNLSDVRSITGFGSVQDCRSWIGLYGTLDDDGSWLLGDYECAVGKLDDFNGLSVYRLTVR